MLDEAEDIQLEMSALKPSVRFAAKKLRETDGPHSLQMISGNWAIRMRHAFSCREALRGAQNRNDTIMRRQIDFFMQIGYTICKTP